MQNDKGYVASAEPKWNYIGLDDDPPSGDIQVLTEGGICVRGTRNTVGIIAWAPLLKRDKEKEDFLKELASLPPHQRDVAKANYKSMQALIYASPTEVNRAGYLLMPIMTAKQHRAVADVARALLTYCQPSNHVPYTPKKHCVMNCGTRKGDPRTKEDLMRDCNDCELY